MPSYIAPTKDMQFVLHEVLRATETGVPGYDDLERDFTEAVLDAAGKVSTEVLAPLNVVGDTVGCMMENGVVRTPEGFKAAFAAMKDGGWTALDCDPDYGGQGMPYVLATAVGEMFVSANMAFNMYQGLTHGAYSAIHTHGTAEQKQTYLPKMVSCDWTGTMNLTEPHCGTDLGMMRTKAEPQADGSYKITGQKIFISAGEHDLAENIIHLVLAKAPGGGEGTKGISLFIVPKVLVNDDGSLGARNAVSCGKIEEKMGIHGNSTCVMNYDGATGFLVGEEHKGMRTMFVMMNEARLGVGLQGLSQAEIAYQNAADFARDRLQGRSLTGTQATDKPADPIIVHPDVRRMLLDQKAFIEGARAFTYWTAFQADLQHKSPDEKVREKAGDYMALLTPVVKAYLTHKGYECANTGLQLHGGSGFTREWGMEQIVRDCRITTIYEGTNGVQALDLVGRKLAANGGRAVFSFFADVDEFIAANEGNEDMALFIEGLQSIKAQLQDGTTWLMQNGMSDFNNAGASSHDYLHLFGLTALAFMWARMAKTALEKKGKEPFYETKLVTGRYFVERLLPDGAAHLAKVKTGAAPVMALHADDF